MRIIRKVPELVEEFVSGAQLLLNDQNHAVLITVNIISYAFAHLNDDDRLMDGNKQGVTLIIEMIRIEPKVIPTFRKVSRA